MRLKLTFPSLSYHFFFSFYIIQDFGISFKQTPPAGTETILNSVISGVFLSAKQLHCELCISIDAKVLTAEP